MKGFCLCTCEACDASQSGPIAEEGMRVEMLLDVAVSEDRVPLADLENDERLAVFELFPGRTVGVRWMRDVVDRGDEQS